MDDNLADDRKPENIEKRSEENVRTQRGRGDPTGVPIEPRESAPHGTVEDEPQRRTAGPWVTRRADPRILRV